MRLDPDLLAKLEDPSTSLAEVDEALLSATGQHPILRIDISDPPSTPRAIAGSAEVEGKDPDDAIRKLGRALAAANRAAGRKQREGEDR